MNIEHEKFEEFVEQFDTTSDKYLDMGVDEFFFAGYQAALADAPAPPEVNANTFDAVFKAIETQYSSDPMDDMVSKANAVIRILTPSPKAEWSEDGEPLNLRAADQVAKDAILGVLTGRPLATDEAEKLLANLRKFLGDES